MYLWNHLIPTSCHTMQPAVSPPPNQWPFANTFRVKSWSDFDGRLSNFYVAIPGVKIVASRDNKSFRDGRRMILKRCRATISRVLLVHGPAMCRLTYDRQQLINAFMSIRLAVHRRFKPRPVQPNQPTHSSTHQPIYLADRPTNHLSSRPTSATSFPLLFLSFPVSLTRCLFPTYVFRMWMCRVLLEQLLEICTAAVISEEARAAVVL